MPHSTSHSMSVRDGMRLSMQAWEGGVFSRTLLALLLLVVSASATASHAFAQFGTPRYPEGFAHFDYVNPDAPRQGELRLSLVATNASYDKLNPFTLGGSAAPGLLDLVFETLAVHNLDERNTHYGLLAETIDVAGDFSSVTYRLRPEARFSNDDPVTAEDVVSSFRILSSSQVSPRFQSFFSEIDRVDVTGMRTVRFTFTRPGRDLVFVAGSLPVFSRKWVRATDGTKRDFTNVSMEPPIASGPYTVRPGTGRQQVTYVRNPRYWGNDIPVRRGHFNFNRITYNLYADIGSRRAALRSGHYDFLNEIQMWPWRVMYFGERFDSGELVREIFPHENAPAMNGWTFNLRREKFQDVRVRQALNYLFDFEWINDRNFSGRFVRMTSYFDRTPLAATGVPSAAERALLEPYRNELPESVFGPMFRQPTTYAPSSFRANLMEALRLFAQAGWTLRNGQLKNADGEQFVIQVSVGRGEQGVTDLIYANMARAGIRVEKLVSDAPTQRRRLNRFDFDYTRYALRESRTPGVEIWRVLNSADSARLGSENITGVRSKAVDELTHRLMDATSEEEMITVGRALDRVLIHQHYFIPWRYLPAHHVIHHRRLARPKQVPLYYTAQEWAVSTWWERDGANEPASQQVL